MVLAPLSVAIPLVAGAALAAGARLIPRAVGETATIAVAAAVTGLCALLTAKAGDGTIVAWSGGWEPRHGVALGISFTVDALGAGMAAFVGLLTVAAALYATGYPAPISQQFHALLLVFLAGMVGFCLSGDLFNLFVFFELFSVCAYALVGYKIEARSPLEGALNFAVVNSVGSFAMLIGIGLVYGRTGALNLAQVGQALHGHGADALVVVAFALLACGFLIKAGAVPFHFWLADAYAVAPVSVCLLLAGAMSELGLFGIARLYWTAFEGVLGPHAAGVGAVLVAVGTVTALGGAVMCFLQHHLKRLLAFAVVAYVGVFVIGVGLLSADGLAAVALYVVADGLAKAALFLGVGLLQHRFRDVDEMSLRGRGRGLRVAAATFAVAALAIAALPPFGTFRGKALIDSAAEHAGYGWVPAVLVVTSIVTGGALLRAAGRVFLGLGPPGEPDRYAPHDEEHDAESEQPRRSKPIITGTVGVALLAGALAVGIWPGLGSAAGRAAGAFVDRTAYAATVLGGGRGHGPPAVHLPGPTALDWALGATSVAGALLLAALALAAPHARRVAAMLEPLRVLHDGGIGDFVTWAVLGTVVLTGLLAVASGAV